MVQFFQLQPEYEKPRIAESLGLAGRGAAALLGQIGQQQQQSQLAQSLFGEEAPKYAGLPTEVQLEISKQRAKPPPGGLTGQPVPEEVSTKMSTVLNENPDASDDELLIKMDQAGVARAYSNQFIENRRRKQQQFAEAKIKGEDVIREEKKFFHKESEKFDQQLSSRADSAKRKISSIEKQEKILPKITKSDRYTAALFSGTRLEDLFKSQSATEFDSLSLPQIEGEKENFGVRLSDADLRLVLQKIATSTKNPKANKEIMEWQKLRSKLDVEKRKIADEIKEKNDGFRPRNFEAQVRQLMDERFGDEIDARYQAVMQLPDDEKLLAQFTERRKVPQGTPLDNKSLDLYLKLSNNDIVEAERMAREDGYVY